MPTETLLVTECAFNGTIFGRSIPERFPVTLREQSAASYSNYILKRYKFFLGDVDTQEYLMAVLAGLCI
jgi:hypothetical protein